MDKKDELELILLPDAKINIDKLKVLFQCKEEFMDLISGLEVGDTLTLNDCDLKLTSINLETDSHIYELDIFSLGFVYGTLSVYMNDYTCIFTSSEKAGYESLLTTDKYGNERTLLHFLPTLTKDMGLNFKEILEITVCLDSPEPLLETIKERLKDCNSDCDDELDENMLLSLESSTNSYDTYIPFNALNKSIFTINDIISDRPVLRIFTSDSIDSEKCDYVAKFNGFENMDFCRVEVNVWGENLICCLNEYMKDREIKGTHLEIFEDEGFKTHLFYFVLDRISPNANQEIDITMPKVKLTNNQWNTLKKSLSMEKIPLKRYNIDTLEFKCEYTDNLFNLIRNVPVGEMIPPTFDFDLIVSDRIIQGNEIRTVVDIITTEGCFGYLTFNGDNNQCQFEIDRHVFYTLFSKDMHEGRKYNLLSMLDSILDSLNMKVLSVTNLTLCVDSSEDLISRIWQVMEETQGENDDIIYRVVSNINNSEKILTKGMWENSMVSYINQTTDRVQMRIFNSRMISDDNLREQIEEWNNFPNESFDRIEVRLNEEEIKEFMAQYDHHPYGNDYHLQCHLDDKDFKERLLNHAIYNFIDDHKEEFEIKLTEM